MKKTKVNQWWRCDICDKQFEHTLEAYIYSIEGYNEIICEECYNQGMMWAIKRAHVEKKLGLVE